jgi:hypothetical protein
LIAALFSRRLAEVSTKSAERAAKASHCGLGDDGLQE